MLSPNEVLPFLIHSDREVRFHAADFFSHLADRSPPEAADQLWLAIDRFGQLPNEYGGKEIEHFLRVLSSVPQNDASVARAIDVLHSSQSDRQIVWTVSSFFGSLSLELLDRRLTQIVDVVNADTRKVLEHRRELRDMPVEAVWQLFLDHGIAAEKVENSSKVGSAQAGRLVEALAAHPEFSVPHAMAILENPQDRYWFQLWCVDLLGQLRYAPAADLMITAMRDDEGDFLKQSALIALSRLDPDQVVPKLEASFANDDIYYRMRVADALGKTLHPLGEASLVRLLPDEDNPEVTSALCGALFDLCATQGLDEWRQVILEDRFDSAYDDVQEALVTLSKMVDYNPPEMEHWRAELQTPTYGLARRKQFLGKLGMTVEDADKMKVLIERLAEQHPEPAKSFEPPAPVVTIRRDTPKIGRNDPCPCGSGKKYKKCCG